MFTVSLRPVRRSDQVLFARWWRDPALLMLTSGRLEPISDRAVSRYFQAIQNSGADLHRMLVVRGKTVGHMTIARRPRRWYELQTVIGEQAYWGKGYGTAGITLLLRLVKRRGIRKIYLEVRPDNNRAIAAYLKCGFTPVRLKRLPRNRYLPAVLRMERRSSGGSR